jgi:hypothetical protein
MMRCVKERRELDYIAVSAGSVAPNPRRKLAQSEAPPLS